MKKKDLKKRIEDGFSELSPDLFEAVWEESRKQEIVWSEAEPEKPSAGGKFHTGRFTGYAWSLCASLAILCLCIFGVLGQKEKSVYMVLDINPSIQIEMNEAHQVKRLVGLNQDGKDVVKTLKWKKRESVQELLDVIIQDVVEKSYLRENGGILVTLAAPDKVVCENLERTLGDGIDRKLTELKVSGVTTAFQEVHGNSERQGRKLLEAELTKSCGMDEKLVEQMSVMELIQCCQDYTSLELKLSTASEKERAAQKKNSDGAQTGDDGSSQKEMKQTTGDDASKASDKDKAKPEGTGDSSSGKKDKKTPQEEKGNQEGNTDNHKSDKTSNAESLDNSKQVGDTAPSGTHTPAPSEDGKLIVPGNGTGEPPGGGSGSAADPSAPPEGSEPEKPMLPGTGGSAESGNPSVSPGDGGANEPDIPGQPEDAPIVPEDPVALEDGDDVELITEEPPVETDVPEQSEL